jgi:hypothetical protein
MKRRTTGNKFCFYFRSVWLAAIIILLLLPAVSCEKKLPVPGLEINVNFADKNLSDNLLTTLKVKFITTSGFEPPAGEYQLVARAMAGSKTLFEERLSLPLPLPKWQPNRVYEVEKLLYFPPFIDRFNRQSGPGQSVNFSLYFESPGLKDTIIVYRRQLKLSPCPAEVPDVVFLDGWVVIKRPGKNPGDWQAERWLGRQASCWLKNPGRAATLMLRGIVPAEAPAGLKIVITLGDRILEEFEPLPGSFEKIYQLTASSLGQKDGIELILKVNKTIKIKEIHPQLEDEQQVSLRLETIYFR